jgi:threonine dehydrogenase-like Zn-dependent dehydrogenase
LVKLPEEVTDDQAILTSDIFPTGYFGADLANIHPGSTVAVFGCGPVGQFVIASCKLFGAGRIVAIDTISTRLEMAQDQGAEIINFSSEDPVEAIRELTNGIGVDRAVDAVASMPIVLRKAPHTIARRAKNSTKKCKRLRRNASRKAETGILAPPRRKRCNGPWMRSRKRERSASSAFTRRPRKPFPSARP